MLIVTSGHIDHGKTSLIRTLTGIETDRLPEEKARGISIDLGFAYWRPDDGPTIGFIDVPGHERFIRNMLAGLSGARFALLVVAADDGIMPQTVEHLRILNLLGVDRGAVVLTKIDRVDAERLAEVRKTIDELIRTTTLAGSQIFPVSTLTGEGIPALATALLAARDPQPSDQSHHFRLAIDRAFSVTGAGTVVTGTVVSGRVELGDALIVSPLGREVRLRGLQSGGRKVEAACTGERCALNLAGIEVNEVHRGDWLLAHPAHAPTTRMEVSLTLLAERPTPLKHDVRVQLHIGAAAIGARLLTPRQRAIAPGTDAVVQLVLDEPTTVVSDDRFILRDQSGRELLGGGKVFDPLATAKRRPLAEREARAAALAKTDPADKLMALASEPGIEPDTHWFARACNLTDNAMADMLAKADIVLAGKKQSIAIAASRFDRLGLALKGTLELWHRDRPGEGGMPRRAARMAIGEPVSTELFTSLVRALVSAGQIEVEGALLRLPGHSASFSQIEIDFWRRALALFEGHEPKPIVIAELARGLHCSEAAATAMMMRRRSSGDLWQVTETKFMVREHVASLVALAAKLDAASPNGFTAAQLRDASGIGRNFIIQLLEFFDRIGVTRRHGECRRMRSDWEAVVGAADPIHTKAFGLAGMP